MVTAWPFGAPAQATHSLPGSRSGQGHWCLRCADSVAQHLTSLELVSEMTVYKALQHLTSCLGLRELCLNARGGCFAVDARDSKQRSHSR